MSYGHDCGTAHSDDTTRLSVASCTTVVEGEDEDIAGFSLGEAQEVWATGCILDDEDDDEYEKAVRTLAAEAFSIASEGFMATRPRPPVMLRPFVIQSV